MLKGKHILIIVENLPLPFDRRVWQEANTLKENGADVSIICPKMKGYIKSHECINGINIYRHPLPLEGKGALGYLWEYASSLFWEFILAWKIYFKKRFQVIQGCNPPDLIFLAALVFRLFGVRYVFDHHDVNPELYITKYGKKDFFYKFLLAAERFTFATASYSIATNESFKEIAIRRGKMKPERVQIVRSGPNLNRLKAGPGDAKYKKGRTFLIGYIGVIGEQEGMDILLESIRYIVSKRQDVQFAIIGGGTGLKEAKELATRQKLDGYVDFYGMVTEDELLLAVINTADVCVSPDKPTDMNNISTMNKVMEYMAVKKPIVQYDLKENRFSAQQASLYAINNDPVDFAEKILWLLDHPAERAVMGEFGYNRVLNELSWKFESQKLLDFYGKVFK